MIIKNAQAGDGHTDTIHIEMLWFHKPLLTYRELHAMGWRWWTISAGRDHVKLGPVTLWWTKWYGQREVCLTVACQWNLMCVRYGA